MINLYSPVMPQYRPQETNITNQAYPQLNQVIKNNIKTYGMPLAIGTSFTLGLGLIMKISKPLVFWGTLVVNPIAYAVGVYYGKNK